MTESETTGPAPGSHEPQGDPSPGGAAPAGEGSGLPAEEEPVTTGTLFIMILFLMALAGMWALMYLVLLGR